MKLPKNWDKPSKDNSILCQKFESLVYVKETFELHYRLFLPSDCKKVPLVLYLHGADAVGEDNKLQLSMHNVGTVFAKDEVQDREACIVVAPQYRHGAYWSSPRVEYSVMKILRNLISEGKADPERVYIYGYSAGGVGTFHFLKEHPDFFAGAVAICGATGEEKIDNLLKTPLWMIHAEDDNIVRASYKEENNKFLTHFGSDDIYSRLKDRAVDMHYTRLPSGYMMENFGVHPHCSWVYFSDKKGLEIRKWLFEKSKACHVT
ncbi:MAG: prolyl oligopeptidase family serine peptidase [Butyrivibrio sp.]|nr:prolyl oligopeptidase family serine peptidase [Butyrivibrio sp.]